MTDHTDTVLALTKAAQTIRDSTRAHVLEAIRLGIKDGLEFGDVVRLFAEHQSEHNPELLAYINAAPVSDGEVEVDSDAIVSPADNLAEAGGAYVSAWVWVSNEDLEPDERAALGINEDT